MMLRVMGEETRGWRRRRRMIVCPTSVRELLMGARFGGASILAIQERRERKLSLRVAISGGGEIDKKRARLEISASIKCIILQQRNFIASAREYQLMLEHGF